MKIIEIQISELKKYSLNSKRHPQAQIEGIAESIKRFGFTQPIVVDKNNEIIIGHGRLDAAKLAGLAKVPCVILDSLSEQEIKALRLIDNRIAETGWDTDLLGLDLKEITFDFAPFNIEFSGIQTIEQFEQNSEKIAGNLSDKFLIPPFSVLNAREGWWQDRKRAWIALGIKSEVGRGGRPELAQEAPPDKNQLTGKSAEPGGSARPACDYSKRQRGDGRGRPLR